MHSRSSLKPDAEEACRLGAVVLLAGRVGRNELADGIGRSILDLPAGAAHTILARWVRCLDELAESMGVARLRVLVAVDRNGPAPSLPTAPADARVALEVVRDPEQYRGPAGVVKDLTRGFGDDDLVLIAAANQIPVAPLFETLASLDPCEEGVGVVPNEGSEFAAMFQIRCARLRSVPEVGYVDLKEQAIPSSTGLAPLAVVRRPAGSTLPIRTLDEYIQALRTIHRAGGARGDAFAETWQPVFSIVEPGAMIAPGAIVQDSVVLSGGRVEEGAAVARSVICAGGVVRRGQSVVEKVVVR